MPDSVPPVVKKRWNKPHEILGAPYLAYPDADWPAANLELRLWRSLVTQVQTSYAVVRVNGDLFLRRVTWMRDDNRGTTDYKEIIDAVSCPMPEASFMARIEALRGIEFPLFAEADFGFDGQSAGLELKHFGGSRSVSWWCSPPDSWAALENWFARAEYSFEKMLPAIPAHFPMGYRIG